MLSAVRKVGDDQERVALVYFIGYQVSAAFVDRLIVLDPILHVPCVLRGMVEGIVVVKVAPKSGVESSARAAADHIDPANAPEARLAYSFRPRSCLALALRFVP
jgi:hypothetical protein